MTKNNSAVQSSPNLLSSSGDKSISPKGTKKSSNNGNINVNAIEVEFWLNEVWLNEVKLFEAKFEPSGKGGKVAKVAKYQSLKGKRAMLSQL